eukprot:13804-Heterococcus_DN1.PRE.2
MFDNVGSYTIVGRCHERHILDVVFERYMEADVAVEECEHQLQDLNMLSVRTQRPLKFLFKPHDFDGGSYIDQAAAAATATANTAVQAVRTAVTYSEAPLYGLLITLCAAVHSHAHGGICTSSSNDTAVALYTRCCALQR